MFFLLEIVNSFIHLHRYYLFIFGVTMTTTATITSYREEETWELLASNHNNYSLQSSKK